LVKRQKGVLKQATDATFHVECIDPNLALVQIHYVTEKVVCMIFLNPEGKRTTKNNTDSPTISPAL